MRVIRDRLRARGKATEGVEKAATAATASVLAARLLDRLVPMTDIASDEEVARQERGGSTSDGLERRGSTSDGAAAATTTDGGEVQEGSDVGGLGEDDGGQSEEPKAKRKKNKPSNKKHGSKAKTGDQRVDGQL